MKPAAFDYIAPNSLEAAVEAIAAANGDGKVLAGGQSLMPLLNFRMTAHLSLCLRQPWKESRRRRWVRFPRALPGSSPSFARTTQSLPPVTEPALRRAAGSVRLQARKRRPHKEFPAFAAPLARMAPALLLPGAP